MKRIFGFLAAILCLLSAPADAQMARRAAASYPPEALPADLIAMDIGHSRPQACSGGLGRTGSQSIIYQSGLGQVGGMCGFYSSAINNVMLKPPSTGNYAVAASTSLSALYRIPDQGSYAGNYATTGNPSFSSTANGNDRNFSPTALGGDWNGKHFQAGGDIANVAVYDDGFNDPNTGSYYTSPTVTETVEAGNVDALIAAGKHVMLMSQIPTGPATILQERQTVTGSGPYTATATNATNHVARDNWPSAVLGSFTSGGVVNQAGNVLTKVASCGTTDLTYSVSGAVYTICPNGGSAPSSTTVFLDYSYGTPITANNAYLYTVHQWEHSTLIAGRPKMHLFNCWDQLQDPTDTTNHLAYPGMLDTNQAHFTWLGALKCTDAFKTAFNNTFPGYASKELPPVYNNWSPCTVLVGATTYSSTNCRSAGTYTFPASMKGSNCNSAVGGIQFVVDGVVKATSDGAGGWTGATVSSGSYNCTTGAWTITFTSGFSPNFAVIELRMDTATGQDNGLLDATTGFGQTGTFQSWVTGAAGVTGAPAGWTQGGGETCLANAVSAGALTVTASHNAATTPSTVTDADGTWPALVFTVSGATIASGCTTGQISSITLNGTFNHPELIFPAVTGGSGERGSIRWKVEPDASGHVDGFMGVDFQISQVLTGTWIPAFATGSAASVSVHSFGSGLVMNDPALYNGGSYTQYGVTPFMSNSGMEKVGANWSSLTPKIIVNISQNVPVHFKLTIWRNRIRAAVN